MGYLFTFFSVTAESGLVFAVLALGYYVTYTLLDFPDLTVEGTFLTGAVVFGLVSRTPAGAWVGLLAALSAGALFGALTGVLNVRFGIRPLLAGILVATALITVNLVLTVAGNGGGLSGEGSSALTYGTGSALHTAFPFRYLPARIGGYVFRDTVISLAVVLLSKGLLDLFLRTRCGLLLRAAGDNPRFVTALARDPGYSRIIGLSIGNGFAAVSGALYSNLAGAVTQGMGVGVIVIGLASLIIGLSLFSRLPMAPTTAVIFGALVYQACLTLAQLCGVPSAYNKLVMALVFTFALILTKWRKKRKNANKSAQNA